MYRIFLDFKERALLIPKEVTDAVGATDDFGIWLSTTGTDIKITHAAYQLSRPEPGKPGRPSKLRSNMDQWDEKEKAYRRSIGMLAINSPIVSELSHSSRNRFMICGKTTDDGILFRLEDAILCENFDLTGYTVISAKMLCKLRRKNRAEELT